jgi:hypothetical protein
MALELRKSCERCTAALEHGSEAFICSYECTFCANCASELDAAMSAPKDEAYARLQAAEAHAAAGRAAEARAQAEAALAFYRSVGAVPYVARAEALLGAPATAHG